MLNIEDALRVGAPVACSAIESLLHDSIIDEADVSLVRRFNVRVDEDKFAAAASATESLFQSAIIDGADVAFLRLNLRGGLLLLQSMVGVSFLDWLVIRSDTS